MFEYFKFRKIKLKMNKNMKPGPKPRKTTQEFFEQIEHHASRGLSQQQICHALGISETWWYDAKQKNSEISESYKKGKSKGIGEISNSILRLNRELGYTFCMIEHDMDLISLLCDPVIVMAEGSVLFKGSAEEVKNNEEVIEAYLGKGEKK